ncbi:MULTISPECIES: hypothetical protein [unclassified Variovorax]|uniref:hypothetical protein n=1 Tax=unclassified Variovorax TaxID=663243 RepID=UPI00076D83C9|nr:MULTISPECIES: hypothetical protein [unclassified Variovorax]KWT89373.1 hypothetical protein APY03_3452 [Variovorax sp. WDL1]PNG56549.1 hypothetical protein CHC07_02968 [Variovorax sp. B4]PNG57973.1 hypothetical protein CHC06_02971 [Variovorax sp. B2]VTV09554.1 hypothetical protein WDL1CHR_00655 [Variovorax sp. WDL1]
MTKNEDREYQRSTAWLTIGVAAFLMIWFGRFFPVSGDLTAHYLLVDEIMKHGGVRPGSPPNVGIMAAYPPAAHWLAAVVGWIGGSGLVGMVLVSITSVFAAYLLIGHLLGAASPVRMTLFLALFALLLPSRSLIGWEVLGNFFYPQLLADVVYLAVLLWLAKVADTWEQAALILAVGTLTMWIQPVVAVHIFAAGLTLIAFLALQRWGATKKVPTKDLLILAIAAAASVAAILLNPAFQSIRINANHDGYLEFGYSHMLWVAVACGAVGALSLVSQLRGRGERVDAVLGSACIAATVLVFLQWAILRLSGDGSLYAVKKHMFIVFTLGAMNAVRLIASFLPTWRLSASRLAVPVIAGLASSAALNGFNTPVVPVVRAIDYANNAADMRLPPFTPGNTVARDAAQPALINWMISLASFEHPFNTVPAEGEKINAGAQYAMVRRSSAIDRNCRGRYAESAVYVVIENACLRAYGLGEKIKFGSGGDGSWFKTTGWTNAESWGTWTSGKESAGLSMNLPAGSKGPLTMSVEANALLTETHPKQVVHVWVSGRKIATWTYSLGEASHLKTAEIPEGLIRGSALNIAFEAVDAISPAQVDPSSKDTRVLGLAMKHLTIAPK